MATVTYIPEKTQNMTAMGKVMRYCARQDKTAYELDGRQIQLISGKDCCAETAYREFMATKQQYGKANGMFFYQYVQSFSPAEKITPQKVHEIGCQMAEYWKGHEVLIATHTDAEHIHTHFIINSVSHETGKKLQMGRGSIHDVRKFSDEICRQHNLSIVQPKQKSGLRSREYRAAVKGESWKFKLMNAIDTAMTKSQTKAEFIRNMEKMGYSVKWIDQHKYITYTTPDGQKCRDNKLHDDKYLKERMTEVYEYRATQSKEPSGIDRQISSRSAAVRHTAGSVTKPDRIINNNHRVPNSHDGADQQSADMGRYQKQVRNSAEQNQQQSDRSITKRLKKFRSDNSEPNQQTGFYDWENGREQAETAGANITGKGRDRLEDTPEMDSSGSGVAASVLGASLALANLISQPEEPEEKKYVPKAEPRRKHKQKNKITQSRDDWEMEM